jgi:hypothetical protein
MLSGEPSRSASNDMLIAGLGLGGVVFAMTQLGALVLRGGMPATPTTALSDVFPPLARITDVPMIALITVATIGIPFLVVAGLTRRWTLRALMAAAIFALLSRAVWSLGPASDVNPWRIAMAIARVAVVSVAIAVWGSLAAWSWFVAVLAYLGLDGLRNAVYGAVWQERGAGALMLLVVSALILLITRRAARTNPSP